jgi:hypothetical protein
VGALASVYMWIQIVKVSNARYQLFSTFLSVPAGFLRILASKQVQVDEEGGNESESDNGEPDTFEANTQANKVAPASTSAVCCQSLKRRRITMPC